ncbi:TPA: YceK/YidQ family lipoprotein [Vibrio vulnificus]|uniref:YceK/YidQ family lipoprotein n=1 Tax=Vibrio TaxID=662 RepID=UPI001302C031|nr:YceK/YidQ family lipoprotein [Vibrio navarrensis]EHA1127584.1 YceK/YidQ family lipoprotein [Vibrio navarrensis]
MKFSFFKHSKIALSILLIALTSGCSSMAAHGQGGYGKPFSGTALSVVRLPCFFQGTAVDYALSPLVALEVPLSLATDVVLLPFDLAMMFTPTTSYGEVISIGCPRGSMI